MKFKALFIGLLSFSLIGCVPDSNSQTKAAPSDDPGVVKVDLNLSNFEKYISYSKHQGFIGPSGFSAYMAWFEFKGLLSIGVYDVVVTYRVDKSSYNLSLDISGGGKTDYFDRNVVSEITRVSGTVTYRI